MTAGQTEVTCAAQPFCPASMVVPPGFLLADAVRAADWRHERLPMGKSKNYCPEHKK